MRSSIVFVCAVLLVMFAAWSADAKPDGSFGADCQSCHGSNIPAGGQNKPPSNPPSTPPGNPPATSPPNPPSEPPSTEPSGSGGNGGTAGTPADTNSSVLGVEMTTIWDYGSVNGEQDLNYVFYMVVETDPSVTLLEVLTPEGTVLQITDEPSVVVDNVQTRFRDEGDILIWEYEARFGDIGELGAYGNGAYAITTHSDGEVAEATVQYGGVNSEEDDKSDEE